MNKKPANKRQAQAEARRTAIAAARKAERDHTAARRTVAKAITTALRELWRERAASEARTPPQPDFQSWGAIKTRAWLRAANECQRAAKCLKPKPERLRAAVLTLRDVAAWTTTMCADFIEPKKKAKQ